MANSASRSLRCGSILSASGVTLESFKTRICVFNICSAFQLSDVSLISGLHSDPYFLSLRPRDSHLEFMTSAPCLCSRFHIFCLYRILTLAFFISCRSWPYRWCWFQCLCGVYWRIFGTASLFDWWLLKKSELISKGEEDPCSSRYKLRHY